MSIDVKKEESDFMQIHIGPEVNCDDVEKVENHNNIICCKCSSKEPLILNKKKRKKAILLYKVCTKFLCHTLIGTNKEKLTVHILNVVSRNKQFIFYIFCNTYLFVFSDKQRDFMETKALVGHLRSMFAESSFTFIKLFIWSIEWFLLHLCTWCCFSK